MVRDVRQVAQDIDDEGRLAETREVLGCDVWPAVRRRVLYVGLGDVQPAQEVVVLVERGHEVVPGGGLDLRPTWEEEGVEVPTGEPEAHRCPGGGKRLEHSDLELGGELHEVEPPLVAGSHDSRRPKNVWVLMCKFGGIIE